MFLYTMGMQLLTYTFILLGLYGLLSGHGGAGLLALGMGAFTWYADRAMAKLPTSTYALCDEAECVQGMEHILAIGMVMHAMTADAV